MSINKRYISISILVIILMCIIAFMNKKTQDNKIVLNENIIITPTIDHEFNIKNIKKTDIVAQIEVSKEIRRANKSIVTKAKVLKVLQGNLDKKSIDIFGNQNYYRTNDNKEYISVYSYNILLPEKKYYVVLEKMEKKFFYMNPNSYRLKDDLSVLCDNFNYTLIEKEKEYDLRELNDSLYLFRDKNQIHEYLSRVKIIEELKN